MAWTQRGLACFRTTLWLSGLDSVPNRDGSPYLCLFTKSFKLHVAPIASELILTVKARWLLCEWATVTRFIAMGPGGANSCQLGNISPPHCFSSLKRTKEKPSSSWNVQVISCLQSSVDAYTYHSTRWNRSTYLPTY